MLEQARGNEAEVDAILTPLSASGSARSPFSQRGRPPSVSPRSSKRSGSLPASASGPAIEEELLFVRCGDALGRPIEDAGKPAMERILAVLTADQRRRWNELTGEPIVGPLSPFPRRSSRHATRSRRTADRASGSCTSEGIAGRRKIRKGRATRAFESHL